jgi:hypothetical protein
MFVERSTTVPMNTFETALIVSHALRAAAPKTLRVSSW